jgi:hypothetical protein
MRLLSQLGDPTVFLPLVTEDKVLGVTRRRHWPSQADRLYLGVDTSGGAAACWPWMHACNGKGYGRLGQQLAHRIAYRCAIGPIPPGLKIRHTCDNPPCCNPAHLVAGTPADNSRDMVERGRSPHMRGELSGKARLTTGQVREIIARRARGERLADLGKEYGVDPAHISRIVRGQRWPG